MPYWESDKDNQFSYLREGTPELEKELFGILKIRMKNHFFNPLFRSGISDGYVRYFDLINKRLRTGMIPFVRQMGYDFDEVITATNPLALEDFNLEFTINDPNGEGILTPNEYQEQTTVEVALGARRGIFDHCTAAGKTLEIASLCKLLAPLQITICVPTIELLVQTKASLEKMLGEELGQLGGGKKTFGPRITIMYDGFAKQWEKSPFVTNLAHSTQVLIVDELQTVTKRLFPFLKKCKNAYYRFGFSGSFFEIDEDRIFSIAGYFGGVITTVTDQDTLDQGRSVPPNFTFFEYPLVQVNGLDFFEAYEMSCVTNQGFNRFFAEKLQQPYEDGKTILVLVKRVIHTQLFQEALLELGMESEVYTGRTNSKDKTRLKSEFSKGTLPILIATEQTLGTGTDIPRIHLLLNLGGGYSNNSNKQKYGRSLRSFTEKDHVDIYEPYFTGHKWFHKHSRARVTLAKRYKTSTVKLVFLNGIETTL
jgi:superfamily II DNA or RNA helicase